LGVKKMRWKQTPSPRRIAAAMGVLLFLFASCKDATQVRVTARTNVEYRPGVTVAVFASGSGADKVPVSTSSEPWLSDGAIGDLVVTPRAATDEALTLRLVMGLGRDASTCTDDAPTNCIVARRKLRFVPRAGLRVPIVLHYACAGVVCSSDTTCNYLGKCVDAQVDPASCNSEQGCGLAGDETVTGTSPRGPGDAAAEALPLDAPSDVSIDATVPDAGDAGTQPELYRLASAGSSTCVILDSGQVKCWGNNGNGQGGVGDTSNRGDAPGEMGAQLPAVDLGPGRTARSISGGAQHICALLDNGGVKCWGLNTSGELGLGDKQPRGVNSVQMGVNLPFVDLGAGRTARAVAAGGSHACALLDTGEVKCWGDNTSAQLGVGDVEFRGDDPGEMGDKLPAVDLGPGRFAVNVAAGTLHTCALLDNAQVKCWGANGTGQLGLGDSADRGATPLQMGASLPAVDLGLDVAQVSAGVFHSCARLVDGSVKCWGGALFGELGLGDTTGRGTAPGQLGALLPRVDVGPGRTVRAVRSGSVHACALLDDANVKCWGSSSNGQLGLGDGTPRGDGANQMGATLPTVDLGAGATVQEVATGAFNTCARLASGAVKCWGQNGLGQLGQGDTLTRGDAPNQMGDALPPVSLQ